MTLIKSCSIALLALGLSGCWVTEKGQKTGVIVKFSKTGSFWATYEAELIRGGMTGGSGAFGRPFDFTISSKKLSEQLKKSFESQKEVIISYHTEAWTAPWRGETRNFLDGIISK